MKRGKSAAYLRSLRKRYGLGEFARRKGVATRSRSRKGARARETRVRARRRAKISRQMGI